MPDTSFVISESRHQSLMRIGRATPIFLQGVYPFVGHGAVRLMPLNDALSYRVPEGKTAEVVYVRAGNFTEDLVYLALTVDGVASRYFPIGPKGDFHVPLAIVEPHGPGTRIEIWLAAPSGLTGTVVIDVGLLEIG